MILYHGSNMEIGNVDISKCKPFKDFGCGFYTSPIREQAAAMAKRTVRIFKEGKPCITEFSFDDVYLCNSDINIRRFNEPSKEWAKFVINNRNQKYTKIQSLDCNTDCKYDIVVGPVANDDITALMDVYLSGILSEEALARELTYRDLSLQVSFHTLKSIELLQRTGVFYG